MSVLTDLIYGGSNAVAGLTEGAVNDAIANTVQTRNSRSPILLITSPRFMQQPASRSKRSAIFLHVWASSRA